MDGLKTLIAPTNTTFGGRIRALETGKYVLWVNNSSDTGFIDPYGRPIKRMAYMEKGVVVYEVKAVQ